MISSESISRREIDRAAIGNPILLSTPVSIGIQEGLKRSPEELANELDTARMIQLSLLPKEFPKIPGFGLAGVCKSARHIGGDFYDALTLAGDRVLLVIADVMGKGVPAALFAASLCMLIRSMAGKSCRPAEFLARLNRQLFRELSNVDMFITAQLALVDEQAGLVSIANAGHCPLLIANSEGETKAVAPEGLPLGVLSNGVYAEQTVSLQECTCALLYTDGVTEARNSHGEVFGSERLEGWLTRNAQAKRAAWQLKQDFLRQFRRFQSGARSRDDFTLLVLAAENRCPNLPIQERDLHFAA